MRTALRNHRVWLGLAGVLAAVGVGVYLRYGETIAYTLRLLNAKHIADQFYAEYDGISRNIAYGDESAQQLDVYRPPTGADLPVLMYVYGGSWNSGNKELYAPVAQRLMSEGLVVVIPNYTLYPQATYRRQTREVAAALAWTLDNIQRYGGDPSRVIVGGQSAGAHLSALALFDPRWLAAHNRGARDVCGFYGVAGPYDINAQLAHELAKGITATPLLDGVFEGRANFVNASPLTYARPDLPPILLIHGDADDTVPLSISQTMRAKLQAVGARSQLLVYAGASHTGLLFDALASNPARLVTDLSAFIRNCAAARARG